jgi:SAM-dependent methyltransferase
MPPVYEVVRRCRSCGSSALEPILSLGETPLADGLVDPATANGPEPRYPLDVAVCAECSLVQLLQIVSPEVLFDEDYPYFSSFSDELLAHSRDNAVRLIEERGLGTGSLVVELASNDGYMLRNFAERGIPVLGIDPAPGPAAAAEDIGIPTLQTFFGRELAERLREEGKRADVVIANNVLAHVPDLNGFVAGIATLLAPHGVAVIEAPYVKDLIDRCEFDTIYHEHLCYFSVSSVVPLFARHGLSLNRVEHHAIHGGSLRLFVEPRVRVEGSVDRFLDEERRSGLVDPEYYRAFSTKVTGVQEALRDLLRSLKAEGNRIAGYGAAAKGATLLNSTGIGANLVDFVVDRNVHKQGKLMPGLRIPIHDPARLLEARPDYLLLLAWNFKDEIMRQQEAYRRQGGRFIVPIPSPTVV